MTTHPDTRDRSRAGLPLAALTVGLVFACLEFLNPDVIGPVIGLGSATPAALAMWFVASRIPSPRRPPWLVLAAAMSLTALGDVIFAALTWRHGSEPSLSVADAIYLAAYPVMVLGIILYVRHERSVRVGAAAIDAAAVAILIGIALWHVFVVRPGALSTGAAADRVVAVLYPTGDVMVIGAILTLLLAVRRTPPTWWLLVYGVAMLVADILYLGTLQWTAIADWLPLSSAFYDVSYWCLVAAALAAGRPVTAVADPPEERPSQRLPLLAIALLGAPALAVVVRAGGNRSLVPVLLGATLAISALTLVRLVQLVRGQEREHARLRRAEARLAHQATHDALTGLPNRSLLESRLPVMVGDARASGGTLAVLFVDLDEFKHVNDTLGHQAGDMLLHIVAGRVDAQSGDGDVVARVGGDEFVMIASSLGGPEEVAALAARLVEVASEPVDLAGHALRPSVSVGYAILDDDTADHRELLRNADLGLFDAKAAGRGTFRSFRPGLRSIADERAAIRDGLRDALDTGELAVAYQPRIRLSTGEIASVEALVRWPARPDVPTGRLISVAEDTGLIDEVGTFVLDRAVADIAGIERDDGRRITVAVNVSMRQLVRQDLTTLVRSTLERHGLPADRLVLEITETVLAHDPTWAERTLHRLRGLGVRVEVDDFGTGYSSFWRLSHMPIDGIKIDRTLAAPLGREPRATQIVSAIVAFARATGADVTIEGVERRMQGELAHELGCRFAQGYWYARPLPLRGLRTILHSWLPQPIGGPDAGDDEDRWQPQED